MRILLVNPPTLYRWRLVTDEMSQISQTPYFSTLLSNDGHFLNGRSTLPGEHLGLQSLAASLRAKGHETVIVDACGEFHRSLSETADKVLELGDFELIGFTGPTDVIGEIRWLIQFMRNTGFAGSIVLGNDHGSLNAQMELLAMPGLDYVIRGEGEESLPSLAHTLEHDCSLETVAGLSWRTPHGIKHNPPAKYALDLNTLPIPVRDRTASVIASGMAASMFTKRGCLYRCDHCTTGQVAANQKINLGPTWRTKTPAVAANEFLELVDRFQLAHLDIVDDLFVASDYRSHEWVFEFAELLLERHNKATFMVDCRIDSLDKKLAVKLHQAGLRRVFIGVESGADETLANLNKFYSKSATPASQIDMIRECGIDPILGFIFMCPGDTPKTLSQSVRFLREIQADDYRLFSQKARVYPASQLEMQLVKNTARKGSYPFYSFDYNDRQMQLISYYIRKASQSVSDLVEMHGPLPSAAEAKLFETFAIAINILLTFTDTANELETSAEEIAQCLVADCEQILNAF